MAAVNLDVFVRYLGHSRIAIKSKQIGEKGQQEGHFIAVALNKAEDFIVQRNGKRQLWINLQNLRYDLNGDYISFRDVESYTNVYIDLDCEKPDGFKDYAATDAEREKALSLLPILRDWLKSHGLKSGLELHTGNGCGMVLPIPETKAEPVFIARLAAFLKMVKAEIPSVDTAMFDPPRVIGIPGTLNAKLETDNRKNHMREVVGAIPARVEDEALLDFIKALVPDPDILKTYRAKYNEPRDAPHDEQRVPHMPEDVAERLQELFAAEPSFKAKLFTPALKGTRSTHEFHLCARLWEAGFDRPEIYAIIDASPQTKWHEKDETYWQSTIEAGIDKAEANHKAAATNSLSEARELLKGIADKVKADVNIIKEPAVLKALAILKEQDPIEYDLMLDAIKTANKALRIKTIKKEVAANAPACGCDAGDKAFEQMCALVPEWINEYHFKTMVDDETIYRYLDGVYVGDGANLIKKIVETALGDDCTTHISNEAVGKVQRQTYVNRENFNKLGFLNLKNGLLNLDTGEFIAHTPDLLSTIQLPVEYNPKATCPAIDKFLSEVLELEDMELVVEIIGWMLWPAYSVHKAFMMIGNGRNGKGTLLRLMAAMLGKANVSDVSLQQLCDNRFMPARLYGKTANLGGDLPAIDISDTAVFKGLTGGDRMTVENKFGQPFEFDNRAKLIFSTNRIPKTPDETYAFYSRWILIVFEHVFDVQSGTGDEGLDAKLQTPEELSGLLNVALRGLQRLRSNNWKFSYSKTVEDVELIYKRMSEPVVAFLLDECIEDYEGAVEKSVFYDAFKRYSEKHSIKPMSQKRFWSSLKDQAEIPVSDIRPDSFGPRYVKGVRVKPLDTPFWGQKPASPYWGRDVIYHDSCSQESHDSLYFSLHCKNEKNVKIEKKEKIGEEEVGKTMAVLATPEPIGATSPPVADSDRSANVPKSAEDVVAYIDQNLTEIETPVLHDCLTKWGFSYVTTTRQLAERGWKLDPAARTMTKEVTTA